MHICIRTDTSTQVSVSSSNISRFFERVDESYVLLAGAATGTADDLRRLAVAAAGG